MKRTSPEKLFQLAGGFSPNNTDSGTRLASAKPLPPGVSNGGLPSKKAFHQGDTKNTNPNESGNGTPNNADKNSLDVIPGRDDQSNDSTLPVPNIFGAKKKSKPALSNDQLPGTSSPGKTQDDPLPPIPSAFPIKKPEVTPGLNSPKKHKASPETEKKDNNATGPGEVSPKQNSKESVSPQTKKQSGTFSHVPKPFPGRKPFSIVATAKPKPVAQKEIQKVNHYQNLASRPAIQPGPKELITSVFHETIKNAVSWPDGTKLVKLRKDESIKQFSFRVTAVPGFEQAILELNKDQAAAGGRFASGTMLKILPAAELIREFPNLCPKHRLYITKDNDSFFSIALEELGQAGKFDQLIRRNQHLIPHFGVRNFSGTELFPKGTPIILPPGK